MMNLNLTIDQAIENSKILHRTGVIFTCDNNGNISCISKSNIFGRIINYIRNLIEGSGEHKVNQAILATFEKINEYAANSLNPPKWTYSTATDDLGFDKGFDIGFDKVAMRVLLDHARFSASYYRSKDKPLDDTRIKIRKAAYDVLLMATEQRRKEGISFDCDHLK